MLAAYAAGRTNFRGVELPGVDLAWSVLSDVDFSRANLSGANFSGAELCRVKFCDGADLTFANFSRADLDQVDVSGANLEGANLESTRFSNLTFNHQTKWPQGFQPPDPAAPPDLDNPKPANSLAIAPAPDPELAVRNKPLNALVNRNIPQAQHDRDPVLDVEWVATRPPVLQPAQNWQPQYSLKGHRAPINAIAISADNHWLISASDDGVVNLWDMTTRRYAFSFLGQTQPATSVAISANGQYIASGCRDGKVTLWRLPQRTLLKTLMDRGTITSHAGPVYDITFTSDSKKLISAGADRCIKTWSVETGKVLQTRKSPHSEVRAIALSPDGRWLAAGSADHITLWAMPQRGAPVWSGAHSAALQAVAISPDSQTVVSADQGGGIKIWQLASGHRTHAWLAHQPGAMAIALHPTQRLVASAALDSSLKIWDIELGTQVQSLTGNAPIAFSGDGSILVTQGAQYTLQVFQDMRLPA